MSQSKNRQPNLLVCITQQKNCERLIRYAAAEKQNLNADELHVIHVAKINWNFLNNEKEGEALEYLFDVSKGLGANLVVIKSDEIEKTIANYAVDNNIQYIVLGASHESDNGANFNHKLKSFAPDVALIVV